MKHLIQNKRNTLQKSNSILELHSPSSYSKQSIEPQMRIALNTNSQISIKPVAPQSLISRKKLLFVPQLTFSDSIVNPQLNIPFALQMTLKIRRSQFAPSNHATNNSYYINKFIAKALQISDNKECEHSEQINPIKPNILFGIKSNNPSKYHKLSAKTQIPKLKYNLQKNHSLFAQNRFAFHSTLNNPIKSLNANNSVNLINKMPKTKATRSKSTPRKGRVTFSDTTPPTPATNTSSNTENPSGSLIDVAEDICVTETPNKIFSKKTTGQSHRKGCNSQSARLCHTRRP